jgi:hypothetical protein
VANHIPSQCVVPALIALEDSHNEGEHVVHCGLFFYLMHVGHAGLDQASDVLTSKPIYQNHPLVNEELFAFELHFNSLEHLN